MSQGEKQPEGQASQSPPSTEKVKSPYSYYIKPIHLPSGNGAQLSTKTNLALHLH
jgi:hypothetical protein